MKKKNKIKLLFPKPLLTNAIMTTKHRLILNVVLGNKISKTFLFGSGEVHVQLFPVSVPACHVAIFTTALTVVRDYLAESQLLRARLRY